MNLKEFINEKIKHYEEQLDENLEYYDRFRYEAIIETLKEISYNAKIEDLNNMLNKYKKQQEEYTGQFFSEYHYSLSDRIGIVKSIIKFLEEMEKNNENNI